MCVCVLHRLFQSFTLKLFVCRRTRVILPKNKNQTKKVYKCVHHIPSLQVTHLVPSGWFEIDEERNHNVYVSGLPLDVTMDEFQEMMGKCGIIMEDDNSQSENENHYVNILLKDFLLELIHHSCR